MKKILIVFAACLLPFAVNAQAVAEESLRGLWKIIEYSDSEIQLDFAKDKVVTTERFAAMNPEFTKQQLEQLGNDRLEYLKEDYLYFAPHSILFEFSNDEEPSYYKYALSVRDGKQYLQLGETTPNEIFIKDGLLYRINIVDGIGMKIVYKKKQE